MFVNLTFSKIFYNHQKKIKPKSTIEVGAYDAEFSLEMKKYVDSKNIWAIEANPRVYKQFKEHFSDINYINLAISDKDGYIDLNIIDAPQDIEDWWIAASSILDRSDKMNTKPVMVETMSLDSFVKKNNIQGPMSLWVDVEGANKEFLLGSTETLKDVTSIYIEVESKAMWENQWVKKDVVSFLENNGFKLAQESEPTTNMQQDLIFVRV